MYAENLVGLGWVLGQSTERRDREKTNIKRFSSSHLGRVIDSHVMACSRYLKAISIPDLVNLVCNMVYETLESFRQHTWSHLVIRARSGEPQTSGSIVLPQTKGCICAVSSFQARK